MYDLPVDISKEGLNNTMRDHGIHDPAQDNFQQRQERAKDSKFLSSET